MIISNRTPFYHKPSDVESRRAKEERWGARKKIKKFSSLLALRRRLFGEKGFTGCFNRRQSRGILKRLEGWKVTLSKCLKPSSTFSARFIDFHGNKTYRSTSLIPPHACHPFSSLESGLAIDLWADDKLKTLISSFLSFARAKIEFTRDMRCSWECEMIWL